MPKVVLTRFVFRTEWGKVLEFLSQETVLVKPGPSDSCPCSSSGSSLEPGGWIIHLGLQKWCPVIFPSELRESWANGISTPLLQVTALTRFLQEPCQVRHQALLYVDRQPFSFVLINFSEEHLEAKPVGGHGAWLNALQLQVCLPLVSLNSDKEIIWLGELGIIKIHSLYIFARNREI